MSACIIQKKDLEKLGRKLMKEFYYHIHDDYFLKEFAEVKIKRKYYEENLTKEFLSFCKNQEKINDIENLYFNNKSYKDLVKMETKDLLSKIEDKIKDETLDVKIIFKFLEQMPKKIEINQDVDFEINEDLFCLKKAFNNMYTVYHFDHHYLED